MAYLYLTNCYANVMLSILSLFVFVHCNAGILHKYVSKYTHLNLRLYTAYIALFQSKNDVKANQSNPQSIV